MSVILVASGRSCAAYRQRLEDRFKGNKSSSSTLLPYITVLSFLSSSRLYILNIFTAINRQLWRNLRVAFLLISHTGRNGYHISYPL
jgi:hypothetical protein